MSRKYVFADESGNFDFSRSTSASRYFILVTVTLPDCSIGHALLDLRRQLAWEGHGLETEFHATEGRQVVRDRVFALLSKLDFRIDATILEKSKAKPEIRPTEERFYQFAWFLHVKTVAPLVTQPDDEVLVVGASLGTRKQQRRIQKGSAGCCEPGAFGSRSSGGIVVRRQRPMPASYRLLRLGNSAKVGTERRTKLSDHRADD